MTDYKEDVIFYSHRLLDEDVKICDLSESTAVFFASSEGEKTYTLEFSKYSALPDFHLIKPLFESVLCDSLRKLAKDPFAAGKAKTYRIFKEAESIIISGELRSFRVKTIFIEDPIGNVMALVYRHSSTPVTRLKDSFYLIIPVFYSVIRADERAKCDLEDVISKLFDFYGYRIVS